MNNPSAVLDILNQHIIVANGFLMEGVHYAPSIESFVLWDSSGEVNITIPYENLMMADWDASDDEGKDQFITIVDVSGIHHLVKFYRNESVDIMRLVKEV